MPRPRCRCVRRRAAGRKPALLTSTSTGRAGSVRRARTASAPSAVARSAASTSTSGAPACSSCVARSVSRSRSRATSTRRSPRRARWRAYSAPSPELAPVISEVLVMYRRVTAEASGQGRTARSVLAHSSSSSSSSRSMFQPAPQSSHVRSLKARRHPCQWTHGGSSSSRRGSGPPSGWWITRCEPHTGQVPSGTCQARPPGAWLCIPLRVRIHSGGLSRRCASDLAPIGCATPSRCV